MTSYPTTPTLSQEPTDCPLVPEREIKQVLEFCGLEMDEGRLDVETFDQIAHGLIEACHGDFQCELYEIKRRWKLILILARKR